MPFSEDRFIFLNSAILQANLEEGMDIGTPLSPNLLPTNRGETLKYQNPVLDGLSVTPFGRSIPKGSVCIYPSKPAFYTTWRLRFPRALIPAPTFVSPEVQFSTATHPYPSPIST